MGRQGRGVLREDVVEMHAAVHGGRREADADADGKAKDDRGSSVGRGYGVGGNGGGVTEQGVQTDGRAVGR